MRVSIVNEQDEIIGAKEREECSAGDITRTSGIWITDKDGNILLARRALSKKYDPGCWGPAAAGTVEEGETYETNIIKETEEELGIKNIKPIISHKFRRHRSLSEHEYFAQWFTAIIDRNTPLVIQREEVEEAKWFSKHELLKLYNINPDIFIATFHNAVKNFLK
jgi:isopentenyldiphosphate isomerase